ncbi:MAG: restriction endonuclease subunit S [Candidatus Paceibacterota bacterium]
MIQNLVKVSDLFEVKYGINLEVVNLEECSKNDKNSICFINCTEHYNGISAYVEKNNLYKPNQAKTISVACNGSILSTFYQAEEYYSGRDVYILIPKKKYSELEMLFYCYSIRKNKFRYNYGRKANKTLKDILIPEKIPNEWKKINIEKFKPKINSILNKNIELNVKNWKSFCLSELFEIIGSKTTPLLELEECGNGKYPFVTTQATNNGVEGFYDYHTEKGNILVIDSAVIGYCSYQPFDFSASDHVEKLIPKFGMDKYISLFLTTVLNKEQYRYNYGRKASQSRLKQRSVKLPSKNNNPDWNFMRDYIKSLQYSTNL